MARTYSPERLMPPLRLFAKARKKAISDGFTDNGGAIHSIERILDILCAAIRYPEISHIRYLKRDPRTEHSVAADRAIREGRPVHLEHVMPRRSYAQHILSLIDLGKSDQEIILYIRRTFRLVVLTPDEMVRLNQINRSKLSKDRIAEAGIKLRKTKSMAPKRKRLEL